MFRRMIAASILSVLAGCVTACATAPIQDSHAPKALRSRVEFAGKIAGLEAEMDKSKGNVSKQELLVLLGPPDDIRTEEDAGETLGAMWEHEMWGYGTDRHLGCPTLGQVWLDSKGNVQHLSGSHASPSFVAHVGEAQIRRDLEMIDEAAYSGLEINPRRFIAAVNMLRALGKEDGMAMLDEYQKAISSVHRDDACQLLARALFKVPEKATGERSVLQSGYFAPPILGAVPWKPTDLTKFPRFPLVIIDDIPLSIIDGYNVGGAGPRPVYLPDFKGAEWISQQLRPTSDPLGVLAKLKQLDATVPLYPVCREMLKCPETVNGRATSADGKTDFIIAGKLDNFISALSAHINSMNIQWDISRGFYVRGDGTFMPPQSPVIYNTVWFRLPRQPDSLIAEVSIRRENSQWISVNATVDYKQHYAADARVDLLTVGAPEQLLTSMQLEDSEPGWSRIYQDNCKLPLRCYVKVRITCGGKSYESDPMIP